MSASGSSWSSRKLRVLNNGEVGVETAQLKLHQQAPGGSDGPNTYSFILVAIRREQAACQAWPWLVP